MYKLDTGCNTHPWVLRERGPWGARRNGASSSRFADTGPWLRARAGKPATTRRHPSVSPVAGGVSGCDRRSAWHCAGSSRSESAGEVEPTYGEGPNAAGAGLAACAKRRQSRQPPPISGGFGPHPNSAYLPPKGYDRKPTASALHGRPHMQVFGIARGPARREVDVVREIEGYIVRIEHAVRPHQCRYSEGFETWEEAVNWLESKGFEKDYVPDPRYGSHLDTSFWNPDTEEEAKISIKWKPTPQAPKRDFDALPRLNDQEKLSPFCFATIYTLRCRFNGAVEFRTIEEIESWFESEGFEPDPPRVDPRYASYIPRNYYNPETGESAEILQCDGLRR